MVNPEYIKTSSGIAKMVEIGLCLFTCLLFSLETELKVIYEEWRYLLFVSIEIGFLSSLLVFMLMLLKDLTAIFRWMFVMWLILGVCVIIFAILYLQKKHPILANIGASAAIILGVAYVVDFFCTAWDGNIF